jgi:hypothetical protein
MPTLIAAFRARAIPAMLAFWRWWSGELCALVPASLTLALPGGSPRADVRPARDKVEIVRTNRDVGERLVEARPLTAFDEQNWTETAALLAGHRTRVVLAFPQIYWLNLKLPKAARSRLRTAIPLQLREHSPLLPELLDWSIGAVRLEGDQLRVEVVIVRTTTLDQITDGFVGHDLAVPPMFGEHEDGRVVLLRRGSGRQRGSRSHRLPWSIAIALLLSTPLWVLGTLELKVANERQKVEMAELDAAPKLAAERRLRSMAELGTALNGLIRAPSITALIENLASRLPSTVHATELSGHENGVTAITLETADPGPIPSALANDPLLPGLHQVDQSKTSDGTVRVRLESAPR